MPITYCQEERKNKIVNFIIFFSFIFLGEIMYPKIDQRKMQKMMKQMGVATKDIPAEKVIIFTKDKKLIFENPQVTETTMMGQKTYQLTGNYKEESKEVEIKITDEDIDLVIAQTGADKEKAKAILAKNKGDIAATILEIQG